MVSVPASERGGTVTMGIAIHRMLWMQLACDALASAAGLYWIVKNYQIGTRASHLKQS